MNTAVITKLTREQIVSKIKRRVTKHNPTAYHIFVGDIILYRKANYGFMNTYVKAEALFSIDSCSEEQSCALDFIIE